MLLLLRDRSNRLKRSLEGATGQGGGGGLPVAPINEESNIQVEGGGVPGETRPLGFEEKKGNA